MAAVPVVEGAVYKPVAESMVPLPLTLQVTAVQGTGKLVTLSQTLLMAAVGGTPVTASTKVNVSSVPMVNLVGTMLTRTPESSVTVAVADADVPVWELPAVTLIVMVVLAGTVAGA